MPFTHRHNNTITTSLSDMKSRVRLFKSSHDLEHLDCIFQYTHRDAVLLIEWAENIVGRELIQCNDCDQFANKSDSYEVNNNYICYDCFEDRYCSCTRCDIIIPNDDSLVGNDDLYCLSCFNEEFSLCEGCEERIHCSELIRNANGDWYCSSCYERLDTNERGDWSRWRIPWSPPTERNQTLEAAYHRRSEVGLLPYNFNVLNVLGPGKGDYLDPIKLGVELEVETTSSVESSISSTRELVDGFAILKHDGSLGAYGFEIVSKPMGLNEAKATFLPFFEGRSKKLRSYDSGRCGMHIHVSREGMSFVKKDTTNEYNAPRGLGPYPAISSNGYLLENGSYNESYFQIWKIWKFLSNPENYPLVRKIAQRSLKGNPKIPCECVNRSIFDHHCNRYVESAHYATVEALYSPRQTWQHRGERHYAAFNWIPNHTIEYRLFQGTLYYPSFCKNLEFAHALVKFTMAARYSFQEATQSKPFLDFVQTDKQVDQNGNVSLTYPYLCDFLQSKGFIKMKKRKAQLNDAAHQIMVKGETEEVCV